MAADHTVVMEEAVRMAAMVADLTVAVHTEAMVVMVAIAEVDHTEAMAEEDHTEAVAAVETEAAEDMETAEDMVVDRMVVAVVETRAVTEAAQMEAVHTAVDRMAADLMVEATAAARVETQVAIAEADKATMENMEIKAAGHTVVEGRREDGKDQEEEAARRIQTKAGVSKADTEAELQTSIIRDQEWGAMTAVTADVHPDRAAAHAHNHAAARVLTRALHAALPVAVAGN
jgi:hypothetical protein